MKCPSCGTDGTGAFCAACGAPLQAARCRECGGELVAGARYCNHCGTRTGAAPARNNLPWFIAGGALLALLVALVIPASRDTLQQTAPAAPIAGAPAGGGSPPPLTGTPREQADRLFNRIMELRESGDTARARFFLPMGIQAYEMAAEAGQMDADGSYHLSLLQNAAGDAASARRTAEGVLATSPDHLLALTAAAQAAAAQGDQAGARALYRRILDAYDTETARELPEYEDHAPVLPGYRDEARAYLAR